MTTINTLVLSALNLSQQEKPLLFTPAIVAQLESALSERLEALIPTRLTLDSDKPDFESIYLRLVQELQSDSVWTDLVPTGTGMTLLRNIAAGFSHLNFAVERGAQEAMPGTGAAFADSSIFAGARMLGVNLQRRIPAKVIVKLKRLDFNNILIIPRFSTFSINKVLFFNREQITFNQNDIELSVTLYQGQILRLQAASEGYPMERLEIGTESGLISQEDVYVFVDDEQWRSSLLGPYTFERYEKAVYVSTLPNTNVEILFGDNRYGAAPSVNANIEIVWAETDGETQNNTATNLTVVYDDAPSGVVVTGVTTSPIYNGADALSADFYNVQAPHIHASNKRAVRRSDFKVVALQYPGVVDAMMRGSAQLNPGKRSWMNVYSATLLMKDGNPMPEGQWADFVAYMQDKAVDNVEIFRADPTPIDITISAKVFCRPAANLALLRSKLSADITDKYKPRPNALGFSLYHSDISEVLEGKEDYADEVEYVTDILPATNTVVPSALHFVRILNVDLEMSYTSRNGYTGRTD